MYIIALFFKKIMFVIEEGSKDIFDAMKQILPQIISETANI